MKTRPNPKTDIPESSRGKVRNPPSGYLLLECLAYIAMVAILLTVMGRGFYHCWETRIALRQNSDDIISALHVGEQWRADLRAARGPIQVTDDNGVENLRIPSAAGAVNYIFADGQLRRRADSPSGDHVLLSNVRSSQMRSTARAHVTAWTWELELNPERKDIKVRPLFTFEAVPGSVNTR